MNGRMILPKSVCLKSPHRSSAFFQMKAAMVVSEAFGASMKVGIVFADC